MSLCPGVSCPLSRGGPPTSTPTCIFALKDLPLLPSNLGGNLAPADWQGGLGCNYNLGPGFRSNGTFPEDR